MTAIKQDDFAKFLRVWFGWVNNALRCRHYHRTIIYVDTNAGNGKNELGEMTCPGSPFIFCAEAKRSKLPYRAHLIEIEKIYTIQLKKLVKKENYNAVVYNADNSKILPHILDNIPKNSLGLIYVDYNGVPNWQMITEASQHPKARTIDILVRYNTNALWRNLHNPGYLELPNYLNLIQKEYRYAKEYYPSDPCHWSFILLMNYQYNFSWKKEGWKNLDTSDGQDLLKRLTLSSTQWQKKMQLSFTELIENTSSIQLSKPSGPKPSNGHKGSVNGANNGQ